MRKLAVLRKSRRVEALAAVPYVLFLKAFASKPLEMEVKEIVEPESFPDYFPSDKEYRFRCKNGEILYTFEPRAYNILSQARLDRYLLFYGAPPRRDKQRVTAKAREARAVPDGAVAAATSNLIKTDGAAAAATPGSSTQSDGAAAAPGSSTQSDGAAPGSSTQSDGAAAALIDEGAQSEEELYARLVNYIKVDEALESEAWMRTAFGPAFEIDRSRVSLPEEISTWLHDPHEVLLAMPLFRKEVKMCKEQFRVIQERNPQIEQWRIAHMCEAFLIASRAHLCGLKLLPENMQPYRLPAADPPPQTAESILEEDVVLRDKTKKHP